MTLHLPSFSNTDQLLECTYAYGKDLEDEDCDPATFGTEAHYEFACRVAEHFGKKPPASKGLKKVRPDAYERARKAAEVLLTWWEAIPEEMRQKPTVYIERSFNVDVAGAVGKNPIEMVRSVAIDPPNPVTHAYDSIQKRSRFMFPGTLDLGFSGPSPIGYILRVLDLKTGNDTPTPAASGQLLSQALALYTYFRTTWPKVKVFEEIQIGFLHAPEDGDPILLTDNVGPDELLAHARKIRVALSKIGDGNLRPWDPGRDGPTGEKPKADWCTYCDARDLCPVSARDLVVSAADALGIAVTKGEGIVVAGTDPGKIIPRDRLGRIIAQRSAMDKLSKALGPMLQADIEAYGPAHHNGKVYTVEETQPFDQISMASMKRALGVVKMEEEVERLREMGCVETVTRRRIQARNDR